MLHKMEITISAISYEQLTYKCLIHPWYVPQTPYEIPRPLDHLIQNAHLLIQFVVMERSETHSLPLGR